MFNTLWVGLQQTILSMELYWCIYVSPGQCKAQSLLAGTVWDL